MGSAAEQLASNFTLGKLLRSRELGSRILYTMGILALCRSGTYVPLPGIDADAFAASFARGGGLLGLFDTFSGGAVQRMAVFALNVMPYVSASVAMQLLGATVPALKAVKGEGEGGRAKVARWTMWAALALAAVEAYGVATGLERQGGVVAHPGLAFRGTAVATLTGGTMLLLWFGERITARGIGNGTSLIIFSGVVSSLPSAATRLWSFVAGGAMGPATALAIAGAAVGTVATVVFFERAQRRIAIAHPTRRVRDGTRTAVASEVALKLNTAGVMPPIIASSILLVPATLANVIHAEPGGWAAAAAGALGHGRPAYMACYALLVGFFAFFNTATGFDSAGTADAMRRTGSFVPGCAPGDETRAHVSATLMRVTAIGSLYMIAVCLVPELLVGYAAVPFYVGGTSLLIVVNVTLDVVAQVHGALQDENYADVMERASKGRTMVAAYR